MFLQGTTSDENDFQTLPSAIPFSWQHHVRVNSTCPPYRMTLFNNANSEATINGTLASTGLTLDLDINKMTATLVANLSDKADLVMSDSEGTHQVLANGNNLIGYGQVPKIKEFSPNGSVVYATQYGDLASTTSYRVFRLDNWHAVPSYNPKVVATRQRIDAPVKVFMSWNGATDYDTWVVSTWNANSTLKDVQMVARDGFETMVLLDVGTGAVSAEAAVGHRILGGTDIVSVQELSS